MPILIFSPVQINMTHPLGQIYAGDFAKMCGLLRIYELYDKFGAMNSDSDIT